MVPSFTQTLEAPTSVLQGWAEALNRNRENFLAQLLPLIKSSASFTWIILKASKKDLGVHSFSNPSSRSKILLKHKSNPVTLMIEVFQLLLSVG